VPAPRRSPRPGRRWSAAARRLFAEAGFHRVSLDEIARQADVARATVYHQFGSKLGVLGAVVEDYERRAGLAALAELIESGPGRRRWPGTW
jgi:AcrR family transcriptional regulator